MVDRAIFCVISQETPLEYRNSIWGSIGNPKWQQVFMQKFVWAIRERGVVRQTWFLYDFCMGNLIGIDRESKMATGFYTKVCISCT